MLCVYTLEQAEQWDSIVRSFSNYDVYWLSGYVKTFQIHGDGNPLLFFYEDGSARGINVVMRRDVAEDESFSGKIAEGKYFDLSSPYGYGGWLIEGDNTESLFQTYLEWMKDNNIVCEFVRFHPMMKNHVACQSFYEIVRLGEVVHMDLSSPEVIWNNLTSENRNRIRKAIKNDVRVYNEQLPEIYDQFRKVYNSTMERNNAAPYYYFSPEFYRSVVDDLSHNSRVFRAEKDGEFIAGSIMIYANGHMSFHLGGSLEEYNAFAPNNLIMYSAALWGCENGYHTLLLGGGIGSSEDTLLRYKKTYYKGSLNHFFIGKKIVDVEKYNYLTSLSCTEDNHFFPEYRSVL